MTVAIIGNQPFTLARFRSLLIRDLVARGHRVYALCPGWADDLGSRSLVEAAGATPVDIQMERAAGNPFGELRSIWSLRAALSQLKPDAAFSYFVKPVLYTAIASLGLGIARRVAMIEGLGFLGAAASHGAKARVVRALYTFATAHYDALFVMNAEDADYFADVVSVDPGKLHRIGGMGIDVDEFEYPAPPSEPFTFLFVARMLRQKGVWEFVEAAAQVRETHPDARFVMLGGVDDSPDSVGAEELAQRAAAAGVEWCGHVNNVHEYLARASVFVLPSYYREGYPRSIMEAMAASRAVITTDNPGCREAVDPGVNGLLVPPRDVSALAEAMTALASDPARATEMGQNGRRMARERYDYRSINAVVIRELTGAPGES